MRNRAVRYTPRLERSGWWRQALLVVTAVAAGVGVIVVADSDDSNGAADGDDSNGAAEDRGGGDVADSVDGESAGSSAGVFSDPRRAGRPWGDRVEGLLTFRGNPTRTFHGKGPVPSAPGVEWFVPDEGGLCSESTAKGVTKTWCGSGWTGQPAVFERDGRTWVVFGAYDGAVHFLDADTGEDILPPFQTGDIIKGSVTVDPDGYPLVYTGSRDNFYRVIAIDRPDAAVELWRLSADAVEPTLWNNDWDGSGIVVDDLLIEGGENSQLHVVKLNRRRGDDGLATVDPEIVFHAPGWDDEAIADLAGNRDKEMSIEGSVALWKDTVYFANSGGVVQGWDLAPLRDGGEPTRTFRFWTGDDTDATVVVDRDGFLYVGVEYERENDRAREVGQLVKLDPRRNGDPIVWSVDDHDVAPAGLWSTVALGDGVVYTTTNGGRLMAVDQESGEVVWTKRLPGPLWQSPVLVDDVLVEGDCHGVLHAFDVSDPRVDPPELWNVTLGGCIESTPALWRDALYVGTRGGKFFKVSDAGDLRSPTAELTAGGGE